ncbi:hypothetical protein ACQP1U_06280 [Actinomycetota bacterium]
MTLTLPTGFEQARDLFAAHDIRAESHRDPDDAVRDRHHTQEELLFAHLRDMVLNGQLAMWFLLTPGVIDRQLDYEIDVDLTGDERSRVIDDLMNSPAIDDMMSSIHAEFRDLLRQIVQHHLGKRPA